MRELEVIGRQVDVASRNVRERVARLYDALHALHDLTHAAFATTPPDAARVDAWIEHAGFEIDEHGYFERRDVLARARAGETCPRTQIYYASEALSKDAEARRRMYALREVPRAVKGIQERLGGLAWIYYQDATGFAMTYPMHDPCTVVPADFDWHEYFTYRSVAPDNNPEREIKWTPPNIDYGGKGLMVSVSIPLYHGDVLVGVWSFDVPVRTLVEDVIIESAAQDRSSFIAGSDGFLLAHDSIETVVAPDEGAVYRERVSALGGEFAKLDIAELIAEEGGELELVAADGRSIYAVHRTIPGLDWLLVVTVPARALVEVIERSFLDAFTRAKTGDLSHRIAEAGGDLKTIAEGYNDVAEALEQSMTALAASRSQLRAIFDASPYGIALVSQDGLVVDANEELARMVTSAGDSIIGADVGSAAVGEFGEAVRSLLKTTIEDGKGGPLEGELDGPGGTPLPVRIITRRFDRDGRLCILAGIEDITDRRRLQAQLVQTQKMQAVGRLAGGVAHDFNNLLTAILGSASLLTPLQLRDEDRDLVDTIVFSAERAAALTSQLLAFSRQQVVHPRAVDLVGLVRALVKILRRLVDKSTALRLEIDDNAPQIFADRSQMEQVVLNLVLNARDAVGQQGRITIALRPEAHDGLSGVALSVIDNGSGMDADTRERLFEPFFTTKRTGTGLGLATVRDIVRHGHGDIRVASSPGEGTTITVWMPAAKRERGSAESRPAAALARTGLIVVVDDEPLVRRVACRTLEAAGFGVVGVPGGGEALSQLAQRGDEIILVLTDVAMPIMGGHELARRARELRPALPVLLMTGYADDAARDSGVDYPLLHKPFKSVDLVAAVRHALDEASGQALPA